MAIKELQSFGACDSSYYFLSPNQNEYHRRDQNDGDAELNLSLPPEFGSGSFGPLNILTQPSMPNLSPGLHILLYGTQED